MKVKEKEKERREDMEVEHSMKVPHWIWKWAQKESGLSRPTSFLCGIIGQAIVNENGNAKQTKTQPAAGAEHTSTRSTRREEYDSADSDPGHVFTAKRSGTCHRCRRYYPPGEEIAVRNSKYYHLDCYNSMIDEEESD